MKDVKKGGYEAFVRLQRIRGNVCQFNKILGLVLELKKVKMINKQL